MKRAVLATTVLLLARSATDAATTAGECSSYFISEINLVSTVETEAGHVQTFVGFGSTKEDAEKNALGWCSRIRFDLETCLSSDRVTGPNVPSDQTGNSLHSKYMKAVKRITGCT